MKVESPLRDDDRLSGGSGEFRDPVQTAHGGGEYFLPLLLVIKRAGRSVRIRIARAAVPVEDVGPDVINVGTAGPGVGYRRIVHVEGPEEPEMLAGHCPHRLDYLPPG